MELDDDALPNGAVSPFSTSGKETTVSTAVADKTISAVETAVLEKPPGSSVLMPSKSFTIDGKPQVRTADWSKVEKKVDVPTSITSSVSDPIFKPITAASNTSLGFNQSTTPNGSVANPPLFNFGNKVVPSMELTAADAPPQDSTKSGSLFGLEKVPLSKEPGTDAPFVNSGFNKNVGNVSRVPVTFSSSVGESAVFKFGSSSDSKPISSIRLVYVIFACFKTLKVSLYSHIGYFIVYLECVCVLSSACSVYFLSVIKIICLNV